MLISTTNSEILRTEICYCSRYSQRNDQGNDQLINIHTQIAEEEDGFSTKQKIIRVNQLDSYIPAQLQTCKILIRFLGIF